MNLKDFFTINNFTKAYKQAAFYGFLFGILLSSITFYIFTTPVTKKDICKFEFQEIDSLRTRLLTQDKKCSSKIDQAKTLGFDAGKKTCTDVTLEQKCNEIFDRYLEKHCRKD